MCKLVIVSLLEINSRVSMPIFGLYLGYQDSLIVLESCLFKTTKIYLETVVFYSLNKQQL